MKQIMNIEYEYLSYEEMLSINGGIDSYDIGYAVGSFVNEAITFLILSKLKIGK